MTGKFVMIKKIKNNKTIVVAVASLGVGVASLVVSCNSYNSRYDADATSSGGINILLKQKVKIHTQVHLPLLLAQLHTAISNKVVRRLLSIHFPIKNQLVAVIPN